LPETVNNGTANPLSCESLKGNASRLVKPVNGFQQPNQAVTNQVAFLNGGRQQGFNAGDNPLD
jgi:hypothetical protein